jgi:hypothetical protein
VIKPLNTPRFLSGRAMAFLQTLLLTATSLVCVGQAIEDNFVTSGEIVPASSKDATSSSRGGDGRALKVNVD